jgi:hypothetical protein
LLTLLLLLLGVRGKPRMCRSLWLIVPPAFLNVPTSRHQKHPHLPTRSALQQRKLDLLTYQLSPLGAPTPADAFHNLAAEAGTTAMSGNTSINFAKDADFHDTSWDLLHAANLRYGTHGFTSLPKEGVLEDFYRP